MSEKCCLRSGKPFSRFVLVKFKQQTPIDSIGVQIK